MIEAHDGSVRTMALRPDKRGFASGGSDKKVHFWDFEWSESENRMTLSLMRTFEVAEDVLHVGYSPDQKIIAVSLLDCTVKLFYHDTLKLFLTLFGHKLPVTCFDIASDNSMIITSSLDKSIKIWGMDFGDCRKSLSSFHHDSVTSVAFIANTHYFMSSSRDKQIKYWDADRFQLITTVGQQVGSISKLAISRFGGFMVSCGEDKTLKIWNRTEDQVRRKLNHIRVSY